MSTGFDDEPSARFRSGGWLADGPHRAFALGAAGFAFLGAAFSAVSTQDFVQHLDRQMHSIHCSFIPGATREIGESGCRTVMMSPYSSLFRSSFWGGMPISLLALAVFSFLVYRALDLAFTEDAERTKARFFLIASLLPLGMTLIYGTISAVAIGALCKVCGGIYVSSIGLSLLAYLAYSKTPDDDAVDDPMPRYLSWFAMGVGYVGALAALYLMFAPTSAKIAEGCGSLVRGDDPSGIMIPIQPRRGGTRSIAVLDPLCPACKAFDDRLHRSGMEERLDLSAVLFPLDASCNWMVKESLHPGACAVSEAILCTRDKGRRVLDWAFLHQEELKLAAANGDGPVRERLQREFPEVKGCLGTPGTKAKLNKSLRWGVANAIPVLTPQLFVADRRVCDEDTDLGLEYTLATMLDHPTQAKKGARR